MVWFRFSTMLNERHKNFLLTTAVIREPKKKKTKQLCKTLCSHARSSKLDYAYGPLPTQDIKISLTTLFSFTCCKKLFSLHLKMLGPCVTYGHCLKQIVWKNLISFIFMLTGLSYVKFHFSFKTSEKCSQITCHYLNVLNFPIQISSAALQRGPSLKLDTSMQ